MMPILFSGLLVSSIKLKVSVTLVDENEVKSFVAYDFKLTSVIIHFIICIWKMIYCETPINNILLKIKNYVPSESSNKNWRKLV